MENVSLFSRIRYAYLGQVYWFARWTTTHALFRLQISSLIRLLTLLLILVAWLGRMGNVAVGIAAAIFIWLQFTYWHTKRAGYFRFVVDKTSELPGGDLTPLPTNRRVSLQATGPFSVKQREVTVLLRPAYYWQVPLGDHALMVEEIPGYYVYQFFSAETLQRVQHGCLVFGPRTRRALAISFLSTWGPEFYEDDGRFYNKNSNMSVGKERTIYFTFDEAEEEKAVWHNIVHDARRVRS